MGYYRGIVCNVEIKTFNKTQIHLKRICLIVIGPERASNVRLCGPVEVLVYVCFGRHHG